MRYLSLIELMRLYRSDIKERHSMIRPARPNGKVVDNRYNANMDCAPFSITQDISPTSGQIINTLALRYDIRNQFIGLQPPLSSAVYTMPPILEIEWLRGELDLDDADADALQMVGYMDMLWILQGGNFTEGVNHYGIEAYMQRLESLGAIIEVEDIDDTAKILMARPLLPVRLPTIKSWSLLLIYGTDFASVFGLCDQMSCWFVEMYIHLPILLALFMRDFYGCKLSNWSKADRLRIEDKLRNAISVLEAHTEYIPGKLTYSMGVITKDDVDFMRFIFTLIYDKLHELNMDIGTVSYHEYKRVSGPDMVLANVRLCKMGISWETEMQQAEEKRKMADADESLSNGGKDGSL